MTVSSTTTRSEATGNGGAGPFTYAFKILDEDHIKVLVEGVEQTIDTHYEVSGVGVDGGGTITFKAGFYPDTDDEIVMLRNVPYLQETDYTEGDAFGTSAHEEALDTIVMQVQQLTEKFGRTPQLAEDSLFEDVEIPDPSDGYYLQWSSGNLVNVALADSSLAEFSAFGTGWVAVQSVDDALTSLGMSTFFKTLLDDENATSVLTTLGMSTYASVVVSTDDTLASASDLKLPTEQALKAYFDRERLPRGYIAGLTLANDTDASHDVSIAVGECRDAGDGYSLKLETILTKRIDAAWAAGDDAGGMPSGASLAVDTWFHVFLIADISDIENIVVDACFDTSISCVNGLADATGYTVYRRLGSVLTNGSSDILPFTQVGDRFIWAARVVEFNGSIAVTTLQTEDLAVPLGVAVQAICTATGNNGSNNSYVLLFSDGEADTAATATLYDLAAIPNVNQVPAAEFNLLTNTAQEIGWRTDQPGGLVFRLYTKGWVDPRGKNA